MKLSDVAIKLAPVVVIGMYATHLFAVSKGLVISIDYEGSTGNLLEDEVGFGPYLTIPFFWILTIIAIYTAWQKKLVTNAMSACFIILLVLSTIVDIEIYQVIKDALA
jgi:hypothetical protein